MDATSTMKAIRFYPPGGPEALHYERIPIPLALKERQLLIKVSAAAVIHPELHWPLYQHADGSYFPHTPCHAFSGTVVKLSPGYPADEPIDVGAEVCAFTQKCVFHDDGRLTREHEGAAAEYAVADLESVALKPNNVTLVEAASVPLWALKAWQALHDHGHLRAGQRLLVTGAAGATGLWAVQMAKMLGAHVIGTASSDWSFETLRQLGVDEIVDYKRQKVEDAVQDVDLVLDTVGQTEECVKVLGPGGRIVAIVDWQEGEKSASATYFIVEMKRKQLEQIVGLIEEGKLRTFVDSTFPLEKTGDAFRKAAAGHLQGPVLITVT